MKFFTDMHDIAARDKTRDWGQSTVKGRLDVAAQPVPSYQNPWELNQILEIYAKRKPANVLETGPYHGGTLYHWIRNAAGPHVQIAAIDYFDELLGARYAKPEDWERWADDACVDFKFFNGNTHDPAVVEGVREYFNGKIDWLFIDTTHHYANCRQELEDYGAMMSEGGVICFHDIRPRNLGSSRLFEDLRQAGYVTQMLVADPDSNDVDAGIGVVYL